MMTAECEEWMEETAMAGERSAVNREGRETKPSVVSYCEERKNGQQRSGGCNGWSYEGRLTLNNKAAAGVLGLGTLAPVNRRPHQGHHASIMCKLTDHARGR